MLSSVWTNYYPELSNDDALERIALSGFRRVELANLDYFCRLENPVPELKRFKTHADSLGMNMHQTHGYWGEFHVIGSSSWHERLRYFKTEIFCASVLGIKTIVAHPMQLAVKKEARMPFYPGDYGEVMKSNIVFFRELIPDLEKFGVRIGLENMPYTCGFWSKAEELIELLEALVSPCFGITLDTSHLNMSRQNFTDFIHRVGSRLIATHISDNLQDSDRHLMPVFGSPQWGWIDWFSVRTALNKAGYIGDFNLEMPGEIYAPLPIRDLKLKYIYSVLEWFLEEGNTGNAHAR